MPARGAADDTAVSRLAQSAMEQGTAALERGDTAEALRWLSRAHRLVPHDANVTLLLATASLTDDPATSAALCETLIAGRGFRQAWLCLAAARLRLGQTDSAKIAMTAVLSRHAFNPDSSGLAHAIAQSAGWCAVRPDGGLEIDAAGNGRIAVELDGKPVRGKSLPDGWATAGSVSVRQGGSDLLGSPIDIGAFRRVSGCVELSAEGLSGWAWYPGDPSTDPDLIVSYGSRNQKVTARDRSVRIGGIDAFAQPRGFDVRLADLGATTGPIHVRGPDGRDLTGSPLYPGAKDAAAVAVALRLGQDYPAGPPGKSAITPPSPGKPAGADSRQRDVTIVIPVHDGGPVVQSCLETVLVSLTPGSRVLVIDDGSREPDLIAFLDDLPRDKRISLKRHPDALGFPASANTGIRAAAGRDVVLLNSDTLVPPDWLDRLRAAAYAAPDIGSVTPLSNEASIVSYPGPAGTNPIPDRRETNRLDRLVQRANRLETVDIPVGVGFCLYLRRDCLNATGVFRADIFAQGYGEENDLCLRASRLGWRHVALTGLFVGHAGGTSFGGSAVFLRQRNSRIIEDLHPGYHARIDRFLAADPLALSRRRIDLLGWKATGQKWTESVVLITHNDGGGVERRVRTAAERHSQAGRRPIILRPAVAAGGADAIRVCDGLTDSLPNLIFTVPAELPDLVRLLRSAKAAGIEAHHLSEFQPAVYDLIHRLDLPYEAHIHDYACICPRIALVAETNRYCGEPDLAGCEACVADNGSFLKEDIGVAALRDRSATFLSQATRVVVPADDAGRRIRRYVPGLVTETVPHSDDRRTIAASPRQPNAPARPSVCIAGAIGIHKGFEVLLACARDAARRDLDLHFTVVGHTIDDARLLATNHVFVTGRFEPAEAVALIQAQRASIGFVPSICPETWCLGLDDLWRAGLRAAAFDIGAPAERIRRTGHGIVLPLGLPPNAINNALIAAIRMAENR